MDEFTPFDWAIAGFILIIGLAGAMIKVFLYDDPELKDCKKKLKR